MPRIDVGRIPAQQQVRAATGGRETAALGDALWAKAVD